MTEGQPFPPIDFHRLWMGPQSRTLGGCQEAYGLGAKKFFHDDPELAIAVKSFMGHV